MESNYREDRFLQSKVHRPISSIQFSDFLGALISIKGFARFSPVKNELAASSWIFYSASHFSRQPASPPISVEFAPTHPVDELTSLRRLGKQVTLMHFRPV